MAQKDVKLVIADKLYERGLKTLNKIVDTTMRIKFTDAIRLFEAAGDTYRTVAKWRRAAECYAQCADCEKRMNERLSAASYFVDAARAFRKIDPGEAIKMYGRAIVEFAALGRFLAAASLQRDVAEMYEEDGALHEAAIALSFAADYYVGESMYPQAVLCLARAGEHLVEEERFGDAADRFDRAAKFCLDDNLLKFNAPSLAFNVVLCYLALRNDERALDYIEEHSAVDLNFVVSREKRFVLDLILAAQERDVGRFVDHAWNFDYVVELKPFQLRLLHDVYVAMKEPVHEEEEEEEEEDEDEEEEEDGGGSRDGRSDKGSDRGSDAGSTR